MSLEEKVNRSNYISAGIGFHVYSRGGGGLTPSMKGVGMLVVSLRGVTFGFWFHLGCSG